MVKWIYVHMKKHAGIYTALAAVLSIFVSDVIDWHNGPTHVGFTAPAAAASVPPVPDDGTAHSRVAARHQADIAAMKAFRPGYEFWQNVFSIRDGAIAYGSAIDGRLIVRFPTGGDWKTGAVWSDPSLATILEPHLLPRLLDERREYIAEVLKAAVGPVLHNPTRGGFVSGGLERYGRFLGEWAAIYERFGVPAEIGLAQALIESGFEGTRKSEAGAIGLCQWLRGNWKHLDRLDPAVIEVGNQTTQAAYCGAYLSVLATKYGSFIPALSEHHAGGTNVGRTLVNGERLGGIETRDRYFLGAKFARDLRQLASGRYSDIYGSYGPRSYYYAEMTFGNTARVRSEMDSLPQHKIYAMRTSKSLKLTDITRRTGLAAEEVRRYNPALMRSVPAGATLYLPQQVSAFGRDVAFWHRPASARFQAVLNEFLRLEATPQEWDDPAFKPTLDGFQQRFRATKTEEGTVMATVLAYVSGESSTSSRRQILTEFRTSPYITELFDRAVLERDSVGTK